MSSSRTYSPLFKDDQGSGYAMSALSVPTSEQPAGKLLRYTSSDQELVSHGNNGTINGRFGRRFVGWLGGVIASATLVAIVLIINTTFTVWAVRSHGLEDGIGTLYRGSCQKTRMLSIWAHLLINVLSTIMFGGSNYYCMYACFLQCCFC